MATSSAEPGTGAHGLPPTFTDPDARGFPCVRPCSCHRLTAPNPLNATRLGGPSRRAAALPVEPLYLYLVEQVIPASFSETSWPEFMYCLTRTGLILRRAAASAVVIKPTNKQM